MLLHLISLCLPFFSVIFTIIKISSCLISLSQINDLMVLIKICNLLLFSVCYIIALDFFMKWQIWILFNKLGPKFKHSTIKYCRSINVQIIELRNHFSIMNEKRFAMRSSSIDKMLLIYNIYHPRYDKMIRFKPVMDNYGDWQSLRQMNDN